MAKVRSTSKFNLARVPRGRFVSVLGGMLFLVVAWSGIGAHDLKTWLVENALMPLLLLILISTYRSFPLSRVSYTLIFVFLVLHEVGAHWTYAKVPYNDWWMAMFGTTLNDLLGFERNHFDRLVHFSYGLLFAYPIREVFLRLANVKGFWGYFLPFDLALSTSALFELIEWLAVAIVATDVADSYLGMQGDEWDTQKDITCAMFGALLAMGITAAINARYKRDFASEFLKSLEANRKKPLGEESLNRPEPEI